MSTNEHNSESEITASENEIPRNHQSDDLEATMTTMMLNTMGVCSVKSDEEVIPNHLNNNESLERGD
jgi:hypothetical protein